MADFLNLQGKLELMTILIYEWMQETNNNTS